MVHLACTRRRRSEWGGLVIAIGVLLDNSTIIIEGITGRRRERPEEATDIVAVVATSEVGRAIVAVRDATFAVAKGEIVALLGPSGAGKTTLLTLIGMILPPNTGRIVIGGTVVFDSHQTQVNVRRFRRQHLGFVFQKATSSRS